MKKRNCRRTEQEAIEHEFAVGVRKKTDAQIYDHFEEAKKQAYVLGQKNIKNSIGSRLAAVKGVGEVTMSRLQEIIKGL